MECNIFSNIESLSSDHALWRTETFLFLSILIHGPHSPTFIAVFSAAWLIWPPVVQFGFASFFKSPGNQEVSQLKCLRQTTQGLLCEKAYTLKKG